MNNLQVLRKLITLSDRQLNHLNDFFKDKIDCCLLSFEEYFNYNNKEYNLFVIISSRDIEEKYLKINKNVVCVSFKIYSKYLENGEEVWQMLSCDDFYSDNIDNVLKSFKLSTVDKPCNENIELFVKLDVENKNKAIYLSKVDNINRYDLDQYHELQFVDINNKPELVEALYRVLKQQDEYILLFEKESKTKEDELLLENYEKISNRLAYYGYDNDYYEFLKDKYDVLVNEFKNGNDILVDKSDDILMFFIMSILECINYKKHRKLSVMTNNQIYCLYYALLESEVSL